MKNINTKADVKPLLTKMVQQGKHEANFGRLDNAKYFHGLLAQRNIQARVDEILGHAKTVDMDPSVKLNSHFHVEAVKGAAHNVLKKFV